MPEKLYTVRDLAALLKQPRGRIAHACDTYDIVPAQRAGTVKLFAESQLDSIRSAVRRVAERSVRV